MDIRQNTSQLYRITYEAYSKFANDINRCADLEEVSDVCQTHLKYLINFRIIRMTIVQDNKNYIFELYGNNVWFDLTQETALFPYEKELLEKGVPLLTNEIPDAFIESKIDRKQLYDPVIWGWNFVKGERKILVSLLSDQEKSFSVGDVDILKLVVDCVQSKFSEIYLKRQLDIQNKNLAKAYDTIKSQNLEIQRIVDNQKDTIRRRTQKIAEKNEKLLHISALNAHNIREPLSRILGIVQLVDLVDHETFRDELVPKLESTVEEMDDVLKEVVEMASNDLVALKAEKI